jgi:hypothetical protein
MIIKESLLSYYDNRSKTCYHNHHTSHHDRPPMNFHGVSMIILQRTFFMKILHDSYLVHYNYMIVHWPAIIMTILWPAIIITP